ncbi:MAG: hypothetical protein IT210_09905 [Armatimonadetes bacterium]|nr:hypothetical protein [Armatimonadota bacterium]
MKRFSAVYRMAKHFCEQEEFGSLQAMEAKFAQGPYPAIWGIESPALSFLTGQVVHIFDLIRFFGGNVVEVYASYRDVAPQKFAFLANVTLESGAAGLLNLNSLDMRAPWRDFEERVTLTGNEHLLVAEDILSLRYHAARGWLDIPGLGIGKAHCEWRPTGPSALKTEFLIGYQGEIEHFARRVRSGSNPGPDLWDGLEALKITEVVWESARNHAPVRIMPER